jgi:amidase
MQDNIATHPDLGLDTTGGSLAFAGSRPHRNSEVAQKVFGITTVVLASVNSYSLLMLAR